MKIAIIGCGVMGSAFARHFAAKHTVFLSSRNKEKARRLAQESGACACNTPGEAVKEADIVLLAVKPSDVGAVAEEMGPALKGKLVLSILAGVPLKALKTHFPQAIPIRAMPNLALTYGQGVMAIAEEKDLSLDVKKLLEKALEGIGLIVWMPESKIDALTALSGSGIAFVLAMIEAMIDGGIFLGFKQEEARELVLKTIEGAVALMRGTHEHPAKLKQQIASPGGTTIAGLKVLESHGVRSGIMEALIASYEKALKMH